MDRDEAAHAAYRAAEAVAQEIAGVGVDPSPVEEGPTVLFQSGIHPQPPRTWLFAAEETVETDGQRFHAARVNLGGDGPPVVRLADQDGDEIEAMEAEPIVAVFVCPRCGEEEGGTDSPVCASCWHEITDGGQEPVPEEWRWPSDGGPEISDEAAGLSYRLWAPRGEVASFVVDEEGVARCHCCAKLICLRCTAANNRKPVSHAPSLFEKAKRESGEAAYRCEIDWQPGGCE